MLTKDDLGAIRKIVREEIENEAESIKDELGGDNTMSGLRLRQNIDELKDRIKNLEIRIRKMNNEEGKEEEFL